MTTEERTATRKKWKGFGRLFRRKSTTKSVKTNSSSEVIPEMKEKTQSSPKRKNSRKKSSLSTPPFQDNMSWDTGGLFRLDSHEHKNHDDFEIGYQLEGHQFIEKSVDNNADYASVSGETSNNPDNHRTLFIATTGDDDQQHKTAVQTLKTKRENGDALVLYHPAVENHSDSDDKGIDDSSSTLKASGNSTTSSSCIALNEKLLEPCDWYLGESKNIIINPAQGTANIEDPDRLFFMEKNYEFHRSTSGASSPTTTIEDITKNFEEIIQQFESNLNADFSAKNSLDTSYTIPIITKTTVSSTLKTVKNTKTSLSTTENRSSDVSTMQNTRKSGHSTNTDTNSDIKQIYRHDVTTTTNDNFKENDREDASRYARVVKADKSNRYSTIAVTRPSQQKSREPVWSTFQDNYKNGYDEQQSGVKMRDKSTSYGTSARAQSVMILSNIDDLDQNASGNDKRLNLRHYTSKIPVTCFEDEYYEKETLKDDEFMHTIKFGYSDGTENYHDTLASQPLTELFIVHPASLTPDISRKNGAKPFHSLNRGDRRKTTEIYCSNPSTITKSTATTTKPFLSPKPVHDVMHHHHRIGVKSADGSRSVSPSRFDISKGKVTTGGRKMEDASTNTYSIHLSDVSSTNVHHKAACPIEENHTVLQKRLDKEREILHSMFEEWHERSERNEYAAKKDGTLSTDDALQVQRLQTTVMEQYELVEKLRSDEKMSSNYDTAAAPLRSLNFPTTPEPNRPLVNTDHLVYKSGPQPYKNPNNGRQIAKQDDEEQPIQIRRLSKSFYNKFSRDYSSTVDVDASNSRPQSRRNSSTSNTVVGKSPHLPADELWDFGASKHRQNGNVKNEIVKPSQLFAYSTKKHENDGPTDRTTGDSSRPQSRRASVDFNRYDQRLMSDDSTALGLLYTTNPAGQRSTDPSAVYRWSTPDYVRDRHKSRPTPLLANSHKNDSNESKFYYNNCYAPQYGSRNYSNGGASGAVAQKSTTASFNDWLVKKKEESRRSPLIQEIRAFGGSDNLKKKF